MCLRRFRHASGASDGSPLTPFARRVVRVQSNKKVTCQIVYATLAGDKTVAAAYSSELPKYGLTIGLCNYAAGAWLRAPRHAHASRARRAGTPRRDAETLKPCLLTLCSRRTQPTARACWLRAAC